MKNAWWRKLLSTHGLALLLLIWMAVAGLVLARRDSLTTDEGIHTASGYLILTRHDYRFDPEHPALFKMLSALPLLSLDLNLPPNDQALWQAAEPIQYDSWREARNWTEEWFYTSGNPTEKMVFLSRLPALVALVLLGALVYLIGCSWFTPQVGLLALFFTAFNPSVLAHGHLANTDIPFAAALLFALHRLWLYASKQDWKNALWLGLAAGLTLLTKFSAVGLAAVIVIFFLIRLAYKAFPLKKAVLHLLGVGTVAWLCIWVAYLGIYDPGIPSDWPLDWLLPSYYVKGVQIIKLSSVWGRPSYLLGTEYPAGMWFYFPVVYFLKTQLAGLFVLALGIWGCLRFRLFEKHDNGKQIFVLTTLVFGYLAVSSKLNIGIRHISPLLVLASFVMAAGLFTLKKTRHSRLIPLAMLLYVLPVFWQFSNLIGFTNIFVRREISYFYMRDSNLEWGQQSKEIADTARQQFPGEPLYMNYFWSPYALRHYGANVLPFDSNVPPRRSLIGVTAIQLSSPEYAHFRKENPILILHNHTFFYRLP